MPWKVSPVSDLRIAFVHQVLSLGKPIAAASREFGISRKTAYKWLKRYAHAPLVPLSDQSRRPASSPSRTDARLESVVLLLRDRFGWGPRKIRALIAPDSAPVPSIRTFANILKRNGRGLSPQPPTLPDPHRFERSAPNQLWQCDFKGPLEIQRRRVTPFSLLDDYSRYLLALTPCTDQTMA